MNPYTLALQILMVVLGFTTCALWMAVTEFVDPKGDDFGFLKYPIISTTLLVLALLTLPFLANDWDCDNATHPEDRPCEVDEKR